MAGKVAFVTGAGSGIGRATALAFAAADASVVVVDIGGHDTVRRIEDAGGRAVAVTCDVTRESDVRAALDRTGETFGRLDVAFNNAGVEQPLTAAADIHLQDRDQVLAVARAGTGGPSRRRFPSSAAAGRCTFPL